ncbi:hypothetical protein ACJMK2_031898 [Sinanodonta woodiana]|uniref:Uncharacterized protein n=1 Tax=Sinanodonta woodiana TaxID=1069815 RepID=A0ABD3X433_SINWO
MFNMLICMFMIGDRYAIRVNASNGPFTTTFPRGHYLSSIGSIHDRSKENSIYCSATNQVYLNNEARFLRGHHFWCFMNLLDYSVAYSVPLGKIQKNALCIHINYKKDHVGKMISY